MGVFVVKRRTDRCGLRGSLKELGIQARRRMHTPVVLPYQWLCSVLRGHYAYFGLPSTWDRLGAFYQETRRIWYRALNRCSQRRLSWERYVHLLERFPARSTNHPSSTGARLLTRANLRRSRVRKAACSNL